jgi:hypothetical protein
MGVGYALILGLKLAIKRKYARKVSFYGRCF